MNECYTDLEGKPQSIVEKAEVSFEEYTYMGQDEPDKSVYVQGYIHGYLKAAKELKKDEEKQTFY